MPSGRLVLLNGPSSAGKTTLAKAVVGRLRSPWLLLPMDLFHQIRTRPDADLTDRQWQDVFHRTRAAYHRALVGAAACGCDVLGDHVLSEPWRLDDLDGWLALMEQYAAIGVSQMWVGPDAADPVGWTEQMCDKVLPRLETIRG